MSPLVMWSTPATSVAAGSRATTPTATSAACAKSATSTNGQSTSEDLGKFLSSVGASAPLPPPRRLYRPARTVPVRAGRTFLRAASDLLAGPGADFAAD